jgi:hypothetical protein
MLSTTAGTSASRPEKRSNERRDNPVLVRKIWLPKLLYTALPWFYVGAGISSFLATLYINEWFWILPHYVLFSIACIHLGLVIHRRRRKAAADEV